MDDILDKGLGRVYVPDPKDKKYQIKMALPTKVSALTSRYWNDDGWWGDQENTPHCVGYSWAHWVEDGPVTQPGIAPIAKPIDIYNGAQKLDEWAGENYDGTSVRAGAKYLQDKGFISQYLWAWDLNTLVQAVLEKGPVVVGTNWYYNMFFPNKLGTIRVAGNIMGGHAYVINGINTRTKTFRIKNSWGRTWGQKGHAYISFNDMSRLISEQGEVCLAVEIAQPTPSGATEPEVSQPTPTPTPTNTKNDVVGKIVYSIQHKEF